MGCHLICETRRKAPARKARTEHCHRAHCLTKNLPLDSSQNHLHSKYLQLCNKIISLLIFLLQNAQKLLSCVDFGRFFMRQCVALLSFW